MLFLRNRLRAEDRAPKPGKVFQAFGRVRKPSARHLAHNGPIAISQIFDRRLAIDARENKGGKQSHGAVLELRWRLPYNGSEIARREAVKARKVIITACGPRETFEKKVVQAEGEVERRIAIPGGFCIEKHRTVRAHEDVLWADVPMHERDTRAQGPFGKAVQHIRNIRIPSRCFDQIGLDAKSVERIVRIELRGNLRMARAGRVQPRQDSRNRTGRFDACMTVKKKLLPDREIDGIEVFHREQAAYWIMR